MEVKQAIQARRGYRSFEKTQIRPELINDLAQCAGLSASCFNNQPWRYVFIYNEESLKNMHSALSKGNEWAQAASMIIAVFTKKDLDCVMKDGRVYHHFDTGMASAHLILRATELGLVAHPIAGYDQEKVKGLLNIPAEFEVITLILVGKHASTPSTALSSGQLEAEKTRPPRLSIDKIAFIDKFTA